MLAVCYDVSSRERERERERECIGLLNLTGRVRVI